VIQPVANIWRKSSLIRAGLFRRRKLNGIPGSTGWRKLEMRLSKSQAPPKTAADMLLKEISSKLTDQEIAELELELGYPSGVAKAARLVLEDLPPGARLVLFIDQFEGLFTLVNDENHRLSAPLSARRKPPPRQHHCHSAGGL